MTNKELQFALDKALEVAKEKDRDIKVLKAEKQRLINNNMISESMINTISKHKGAKLRYEVETDSKDILIIEETPNYQSQLIDYDAIYKDWNKPYLTTAKLTISAIIGIAAGFILALILL
jgi:hypothetical protein